MGPSECPHQEEQDLLNLVNSYRTKPYTWSNTLSAAAIWMAHDMANHNYVGHVNSHNRGVRPRLTDYGYSPTAPVGENVTAGITYMFGDLATLSTWMFDPHQWHLIVWDGVHHRRHRAGVRPRLDAQVVLGARRRRRWERPAADRPRPRPPRRRAPPPAPPCPPRERAPPATHRAPHGDAHPHHPRRAPHGDAHPHRPRRAPHGDAHPHQPRRAPHGDEAQ